MIGSSNTIRPKAGRFRKKILKRNDKFWHIRNKNWNAEDNTWNEI